MVQTRRLLYTTVVGEEKAGTRMMVLMAIVLNTVMFGYAIFAFFFVYKKPLMGFPLMAFVILGSLVTIRMMVTRGVRVYTDGILVPTARTSMKRFIPFSRISEIRLNVGPEGHHPDVEIQTVEGKVEVISKMWLKNWEDFYRVMTQDLRGKVRVVKGSD
jgi:hypothetical protein